MGYTHYWDKKHGKEGYDKALPILKKILKRHKDLIQHEYDDDSAPVCDEEGLFFNGIGDDGHETFVMDINNAIKFAFCKTERKDYDCAVCECLIVLKHFVKGFNFSSDGNFDEDDWLLPIENVKEHYGIEFKCI
jgi:hypothetical protein